MRCRSVDFSSSVSLSSYPDARNASVNCASVSCASSEPIHFASASGTFLPIHRSPKNCQYRHGLTMLNTYNNGGCCATLKSTYVDVFLVMNFAFLYASGSSFDILLV